MTKSIIRWAGCAWLPWVVWGVASVFVAYQFSFQASAAIMVTQLMHSFHLNAAELGFLSSSFFYTFLLMQIPAGILLDRFSYRYFLLGSIILFIIGLVIFACATEVRVAIMARLLMGLAAAPAVAAAMCIASHWFSMSRFVLIVALTEAIGMSGGLVGEGYMAHWVQQLGWRHSLWIWIVAGVVLLMFTWYWVYDEPAEVVLDDDNAVHEVTLVPSSPPALLVMRSLWAVIGCTQVWLNGLFCGLTFAVVSAFAGLWGVPYLQSVYHLPLDASAWLMTLIFMGVMVGGASINTLCRWLKCRRRLMQWATMGGILSTALLIILSRHPHLLGPMIPVLGSVLFFMGLFSSVYIIPFANVRNLVPAYARGTAMAFTNTCCIAIGAPLLQPLIGWILHREVSGHASASVMHYSVLAYQWGIATLLLCALLAWLLSFAIQPISEDLH